MEIDVRVPVKILSIAERQAIEIAKALSIDARVLVMDEPTSTISSREVDRLFEIVEQLKKQGVAILFISHFIDEILGRGDEVTILRSGKVIITLPAADLTPAQTVRHMIGAEPGAFSRRKRRRLECRFFPCAGSLGPASLRMSASMFGQARSWVFLVWSAPAALKLRKCSSASRSLDQGEIKVDGRVARPRSPRHAMRLGISFLPEDRHQQGLVLQFPIRANETLPILRQLANRLGLVDRPKEITARPDFAGRMRVVATGVEQRTDTLSGGNQQKVLLAKWLIPSPKVLILDRADARH